MWGPGGSRARSLYANPPQPPPPPCGPLTLPPNSQGQWAAVGNFSSTLLRMQDAVGYVEGLSKAEVDAHMAYIDRHAVVSWPEGAAMITGNAAAAAAEEADRRFSEVQGLLDALQSRVPGLHPPQREHVLEVLTGVRRELFDLQGSLDGTDRRAGVPVQRRWFSG